jgi:hypothetical protein
MSDALLLARIDVLHENLGTVYASLKQLHAWQSELERQNQQEMPLVDDLWGYVEFEVSRDAKNKREELEELRSKLLRPDANGASEAWAAYAELREDSERLFEECLEFIGGLAFRRTGLDRARMCELADGLILACARQALAQPWYFLTVPSLREVVTKSRIRLSRIRFPEWTLWTLPGTAHVLGHEIMAQQNAAEFISSRMEAWARKDVAERHVHALLADIFGAYVMGPAYGEACIRLRFDPSRAHAEDYDHPAESSRAHVVLATLTQMSACADQGAWKNQLTALREQWSAALLAARPAGEPPDAPESLDELVKEALVHFGRSLNEYTEYKMQGWAEAAQLYERWRGQAEKSESRDALTIERGRFTAPRDVLNAAWLMRLDDPADRRRVDRVADAAGRMCRDLLVSRPAVVEPPEPGPISAD